MPEEGSNPRSSATSLCEPCQVTYTRDSEIGLSTAMAARIGGLYTWPRWTRSPSRASPSAGACVVSIFAPRAASRQ
jgi:hypothetical protein